jgi:hypothetical protein
MVVGSGSNTSGDTLPVGAWMKVSGDDTVTGELLTGGVYVISVGKFHPLDDVVGLGLGVVGRYELVGVGVYTVAGAVVAPPDSTVGKDHPDELVDEVTAGAGVEYVYAETTGAEL